MDPNAVASMIFVLLLAGMTFGFILLVPVSRRLVAFLEERMRGGVPGAVSPADVRRLEATIQGLQRELQRLSERQGFTESLLSGSDAPRLPKGATPVPTTPDAVIAEAESPGRNS